MNNFILLLALMFTIFGNVYGQAKKIIKGGIVNGRATYLPQPDYPQAAKDFCASGKVEIAILIGENGNVIEAKAISGDELLLDSAVKAVKKAKFRQVADAKPVKTTGIVVYNFVPEIKCLVVGIVNNKALSIPKPQIPNLNHPKHLQIKTEQIVTVQIIVDESGKVVRARAISGHPLLRAACENSARKAIFSPSFIDGATIKISALLVYKFKTDGTIGKNANRTVVISHLPPGTKPIFSPQLKYPATAKFIRVSGKVSVEILIDEEGNVEEAKAISGHPLLKSSAKNAALQTKFNPITLSGIPVKVKSLLIFDFKP